jgi:hypothetical protein
MKTEKERERGEGVGEKPNHWTARSLVLYKSFNTLWAILSKIQGSTGHILS